MQMITNKKRIIIALLISIPLLIVMFAHYQLFSDGDDLLAGYLYGVMALILMSGWLIAYRVAIHRYADLTFSVVLLAVSPVISAFLLELLAFNDLWAIKPAAIWLNIIWCATIYLLLFAMTNRFKWSIIIGQVFFIIIGIINQVVLTFRGSPLFPWDIYATKTALNVASQYQFEINYQIIFAVVILVFVIALTLQLRYEIKRCSAAVVASRMVLGGTAIVFILMFYQMPMTANLGIYPSLWDQAQGYKTNGVVLSIAENAKYLIVDQPANYSPDQAKQIVLGENAVPTSADFEMPTFDLATPAQAAEDIGVTAQQKRPNIIAIMNEGFADIKTINDFATNQDYMPFIRSMEENTIKGNLYMSVYGGGTCNSEFEFLTGNTAAFIPTGSMAYQQYIQGPMPSMASILNEQGYRSIAVHPYHKSGWNRENVYSYMGFEQFLGLEDFDESTVKLARNVYIEDSSSYEKLIELYEAKPTDESLFLFNVTIQNHGGYALDDRDSTDRVVVTQAPHYQVDQYMSLIKRSDVAFEQLVNYFAKEEEPTIIVMFGDHQPSLPNEFLEQLYGKPLSELTLEEVQKKYQVPFLIWANYDIEEQTIPLLSANYLSTLVLDAAGIALPPFNQYLQQLATELPVISAIGCIDDEGQHWAYDQANPYNALLDQYRIVQYNFLFDRKYRVDELFTP